MKVKKGRHFISSAFVTLKKSFSVVLAFTIILSVCIIGQFSAIAGNTGGKYFSDTETINVDVRNFTSWNNNGAVTKAFFLYGDTDDNWVYNLHGSDGDDLSEMDNSADGRYALSVSNTGIANVYSIRVPSDRLGYVMFVTVNPSNPNQILNRGPIMSVINRSQYDDCVEIVNYNQANWTKLDTGASTAHTYVAKAGSSITNNSNLFQMKATFYDYYSNVDGKNSVDWRPTDWQAQNNWLIYGDFNAAVGRLASSAPSWRYPLYIGNFWNYKNGSAPNAGITKFYRVPNTANQNSGYGTNLSGGMNPNNGMTEGESWNYHSSVTGLADSQLNSDNMMTMGNGGVVAPYFDKTFLTQNNNLATVIDTVFPVRKSTKNGDTYYEFNSTNGTDNVWFSNYSSAQSGGLTLNYGAGSSNGMKDYKGGYGFFPFDHKGTGGITNNNDYAADYGFGMRFDVDFNISNGGYTANGNPTVFEFSGDDDVWVYIDGQLVLDLGGAHKPAVGEINFATLTSTAKTGTDNNYGSNVNGYFGNNAVFGKNKNEYFNNNDPSQVHTLTLFYMERGMSESNLKFGYNFMPISQFSGKKTVNVDNVNPALYTDAMTVASNDQFDFSVKTSSSQSGYYSAATYKDYTFIDANYNIYNYNTGSSGLYTLKNLESSLFDSQFTVGDYFKVSEIPNSYNTFVYDAKWNATDLISNAPISVGKGTDSAFRFSSIQQSDTVSTANVELEYINTTKVSPLTLKKNVVDDNGNTIGSSETFDFTILVDLYGGTNYAAYPLEYSLNGDTYALDLYGKVTLRAGQTITINGIPQGASYKITESNKSGYTLVSSSGATGKIGSSESAAVFNNKQSNTSQNLYAVKTLDGGKPGNNQFTFTLSSNEDGSNVLQRKTNNADGNVIFDALNYNTKGTYTYYIREVNGSDISINYDTAVYKAVVTVSDGAGGSLETSVKYYKNNSEVSQASFNNTYRTARVNVIKKDADNSKTLAGAEFKMVAAKEENGKWVEDTTSRFYKTAGPTASNGKATFTDVPLGEYLIIETKAPDNYELSSEAVHVTVSRDTLIESGGALVLNKDITFNNADTPPLPETGGAGTIIFVVIGLALIGIAVVLFIRMKKNKSKSI